MREAVKQEGAQTSTACSLRPAFLTADWYLQHQGLVIVGITAFLFLIWMPIKLSIYPAAMPGDAFVMLKQAVGLTRLMNNHSVLYTLLLRAGFSMGKALNLSPTATIFLFAELQSLITAIVLSWFLVKLLRHKAPLWFVGIALLFFALEPVIPIYSVTILKDTLFALSFLVFAVLVWDVTILKGTISLKKMLALGCAGLLVSLFRNQGIYSVLVTLVFAAVVLRTSRWRLLSLAVVCGAIIFTLTGPLYTALRIYAPATDPYGVMIQQVARVIVDKEELTAQDQRIAESMMPISDWRKSYLPYLVDPIKWSPTFNFNSKRKFLSLWYHELLRHPKTYILAWADQTKGFWDPFVSKPPQYAETQIDPNEFSVVQSNKFAPATGIDMTRSLATDQVPRYFVPPGLLVWLTVGISAALVIKKRAELVIVLVPALSTIAIIFVSTPLAYSLRYVLPLVFTLPLMIYLPFSSGEQRD
jgi:hypothetical protein